jgi:hypothetical protein
LLYLKFFRLLLSFNSCYLCLSVPK